MFSRSAYLNIWELEAFLFDGPEDIFDREYSRPSKLPLLDPDKPKKVLYTVKKESLDPSLFDSKDK